MSIEKGDFLAQLDRNLKGISEDELDADDREAQFLAALERYNKDRPDKPTADITGDGGNYYEITTTTFPGWVDGFSRVLLVEYPAAVIASDEVPTYLEDEDWQDDYYAGGKRYLYLPDDTPVATEKMRVTYIIPYVFVAGTGEAYTIDLPPQDLYALCNLAAGLCCRVLATKYGQSMDPTLGADVVNYAEKTDFYARRSKELIALYEEHMGIEEGTAPASAVSDWDLPEAYIFHGRKTR